MPPAGIMNLKVFVADSATMFHRAKSARVVIVVVHSMIVDLRVSRLVENGVNVCQRIMVIH